jgi:hypothetical protein
MKHLLNLISLCILSFSLSAQITVANDSLTKGGLKLKVDPAIIPYDSTTTIITSEDYNDYVAMDRRGIYGNTIPMKNQKDNIEDIVNKQAIQDRKFIGQKLFLQKKHPELPLFSIISHSTIDSLIVNRYYTIIDFVEPLSKKMEELGKSFSNSQTSFFSGTTKIELKDNLTGDIVYTHIHMLNHYFVPVGFFLKSKKLYENKGFVWEPEYEYSKLNGIDKYSKDEIGTKFKCTSVIIDSNNAVVAILENEKVKIPIEIKSTKPWGFENSPAPHSRFKIHRLTPDLLLENDIIQVENDLTERRIEQNKKLKVNANIDKQQKQKRLETYIKKFGKENGTLISNGRVAIGMNKTMCLEALGTPFNVKKTTNNNGTSELLIYSSKKLYFINGILNEIRE